MDFEHLDINFFAGGGFFHIMIHLRKGTFETLIEILNNCPKAIVFAMIGSGTRKLMCESCPSGWMSVCLGCNAPITIRQSSASSTCNQQKVLLFYFFESPQRTINIVSSDLKLLNNTVIEKIFMIAILIVAFEIIFLLNTTAIEKTATVVLLFVTFEVILYLTV